MTAAENLGELEARIGHTFRDGSLLERAVTHRSFVVGRETDHNEKLEFLGDAVLSLSVSDLLMRRFPEHSEGDLSILRAALVNARILARKATAIGLGSWIRLGRGEERSGGRRKTSILAAAYEALIGAVYLDGGLLPAQTMVEAHFATDLDVEAQELLQDHKTRLQELTQRVFKETPVYRLIRESGPDHDKKFVTQITIGGQDYGQGEGKSKKSAEQAAALVAIEALRRSGVVDS